MRPLYSPSRHALPSDQTVKTVEIVRVDGQQAETVSDCAAIEEPLEVRLHGRPFAVIMRTPGADRELAAGFLFAERVITASDDLGVIEHCRDAAGEPAGNVVNVLLTDPSRAESLLAGRRYVTTSSSCGLCGRQTIDSLASDVPPVGATWTITAATLVSLAGRLRTGQRAFDETGGLHAAGLFAADGALLDIAEDVGRHNAVDKIVGRSLMRDALPASETVLFVSGRTSFEIIQKALFAGVPIVASVSAPSTLAVDLAAAMGVTLVGFVRGERFNIYTHAHRILRDT